MKNEEGWLREDGGGMVKGVYRAGRTAFANVWVEVDFVLIKGL